jgi:hypothetical protein
MMMWLAALCERARLSGGQHRFTKLAMCPDDEFGRFDLGLAVVEPASSFSNALIEATDFGDLGDGLRVGQRLL